MPVTPSLTEVAKHMDKPVQFRDRFITSGSRGTHNTSIPQEQWSSELYHQQLWKIQQRCASIGRTPDNYDIVVVERTDLGSYAQFREVEADDLLAVIEADIKQMPQEVSQMLTTAMLTQWRQDSILPDRVVRNIETGNNVDVNDDELENILDEGADEGYQYAASAPRIDKQETPQEPPDGLLEKGQGTLVMPGEIRPLPPMVYGLDIHEVWDKGLAMYCQMSGEDPAVVVREQINDKYPAFGLFLLTERRYGNTDVTLPYDSRKARDVARHARFKAQIDNVCIVDEEAVRFYHEHLQPRRARLRPRQTEHSDVGSTKPNAAGASPFNDDDDDDNQRAANLPEHSAAGSNAAAISSNEVIYASLCDKHRRAIETARRELYTCHAFLAARDTSVNLKPPPQRMNMYGRPSIQRVAYTTNNTLTPQLDGQPQDSDKLYGLKYSLVSIPIDGDFCGVDWAPAGCMNPPYVLRWVLVESEYAATITNAWVIDDRGLVAPKFDNDSYDGHGHLVWAWTSRLPKGFNKERKKKKPRGCFHGIDLEWVIALSSALPVEMDEVPIEFITNVLNYVHEWALRTSAVEVSSPIPVDRALGADTWQTLSRTLAAAEAHKDVDEDQRTVIPDWPPDAPRVVICRAGRWDQEGWLMPNDIYSTVPVDKNGKVIRCADRFSRSTPFPILKRLMEECARDKRLHYGFWARLEDLIYESSELTSNKEFVFRSPSVLRVPQDGQLLEWPKAVEYSRWKRNLPRAIRPGFLRFRRFYLYFTSASWDIFVASLVLSMVAVCRRIRSRVHELPPDTRDTESLSPPFDYDTLRKTPFLKRFEGAVCADNELFDVTEVLADVVSDLD
jgi:hypothetical protein